MLKKSILIVDDEPRITESLKSMLENNGMKAVKSSTGTEAIDAFKKSPVKVIIADIQMPGMNGFDLLNHIKKIDPFVQFIFLTGHSNIENAKTAFQKNAFEFFKKPVGKNILVQAIESAEKKYDLLKKQVDKIERQNKAVTILGKVFNSIDAIVYVSDMTTYELIFANDRFNLEFGNRDGQSVIGKKCWEVNQNGRSSPCSFCTNSRIVDDNGQPSGTYEWEYYNNRSQTIYRVIDKAIEWIDGRIVRLETAYDITEKRKNEMRFKRYEKKYQSLKRLETIGTLTGGIAHQFNNCLSVIMGHIDLIGVKFPEHHEIKKHLNTMLTHAQKMSHQTYNLLAYARGGKYRSERFPFTEAIQNVIEKMQDKLPSTVNLVVDLSQTPYYVKADKNQMEMLVSVILENAVEAMDRIGTVVITCGKDKLKQKKINAPAGTDYVCMTVIDDGSGMEKETIENIFKPFFTTKFVGRGLGMSAAYGIVKNHNGFIYVESKVERGSTVTVFLPIHSDPENPSAANMR